MVKTLRSADVIARFGGEEFTVMMHNTRKNKAKKVISRLRGAVKKNLILKKYGVTFSAGIADYEENDTNNKMLKRADKALYKAKDNGRNRTEIG